VAATLLFAREVDAEERQRDEQRDGREGNRDDEPRLAAVTERFPPGAAPEDDQPGDCGGTDHQHRRKQNRPLEREICHPDAHEHEGGDEDRSRCQADAHGTSVARRYARSVAETNYVSGEDYVVEFLGYRFGFNVDDFEQRVTAAAVKLGLVADNELDHDETADLVELVERDWIDEPRSELGRYLVRHWERVSLVGGESLVYWLKKLVFRGAWLDHRVKEGLLEVAWDDEISDFGYRDPRGGRALLELAPVPSWHELQFRR
jgi:hypothetical protein